MSTPFGAAPSQQDQFSLPRGEILGRYESYLDAQKVVDYLADHDFPVANVSIIGCDLKSVERVTAKLSYPRVALAGAAQGAMFGVFVGLLLSLFNGGNPLGQLLSSIALGMVIWMIVGVVGYSFRRGKRDFASSSQIMAGYYDVVVAFEHAQAARNLASSLPMSRVQAANVTPAWAPPRDTTGGSQGAGAGQESQGAASPSSASAPAQPRPGYEDLPDGRPRFGARIEPKSAAPAATEAGQAKENDGEAPAAHAPAAHAPAAHAPGVPAEETPEADRPSEDGAAGPTESERREGRSEDA